MDQDLRQEIIDAVEKNGCYVVNVVPQPDGQGGDEIYSYTVGLPKSVGWPELVCFGRAIDEGTQMLGSTIRECWGREMEPRAGLEVSHVLRDFPVKLVQNDELDERLGFADWYAEQRGAPKPERLQVLWPDRSGYFPDDTRCDPVVKAAQTPRMSV